MKRSAVLIAFVAACGGGADDLTCEILQDTENCWARAGAAMAACLPAGEVGTLARDRSSCAFTDGTTVTFDEPLPDTTEQLERLGFSIGSVGDECARFVDTFENRMELTAGGLSVVAQLHPGGPFELDCGDGNRFESSFDLLFTCGGGVGPTDGFEVAPDRFGFSIISSATPGEMFSCAP